MRLAFIPAQTIKVATAHRADLMQFIVGGIYIAPATNNGRVRLWKVNLANFTDAGEIPFEGESGKDDSVSFLILPSGDVIVTVGEAAPNGGPGSSTQPAAYRIAKVFPPAPGAVDTAARWQANAATSMAAAAQQDVTALAQHVEDLFQT